MTAIQLYTVLKNSTSMWIHDPYLCTVPSFYIEKNYVRVCVCTHTHTNIYTQKMNHTFTVTIMTVLITTQLITSEKQIHSLITVCSCKHITTRISMVERRQCMNREQLYW